MGVGVVVSEEHNGGEEDEDAGVADEFESEREVEEGGDGVGELVEGGEEGEAGGD